ncbi:MAG: hypothetical protein DKM50_08955 [Candidatus Margulisiibacteriota bacterium]|nr:MAG: hypothetical protein A2X43_01845 [Candidatus Margulisbacteria bacterium GWD2_39_127]OGI05399.1 MAG: hypothetical protein A2X42_08475 [Candidatus Margulisbacteria bacterium GWF2_38_17]OGI05933.1 MAG: hypothetical protein A2X41_07615 [Candidatus Margulisbacteria bacterium GWE2_39_32]PZM79385.1 MAG: hypothetical protein DKM50_08955 [Candidatus Margulisiibacteriota bacterium]HAR63565.1 hypothetical protein [Candidatus Margulisiibacteriota bacterium]
MEKQNYSDISEQEIFATPWLEKDIDKKHSLGLIQIYGLLPEEDKKIMFKDIHAYYQYKYPDRLGYIYYMKFIYDFMKIVVGNKGTLDIKQ